MSHSGTLELSRACRSAAGSPAAWSGSLASDRFLASAHPPRLWTNTSCKKGGGEGDVWINGVGSRVCSGLSVTGFLLLLFRCLHFIFSFQSVF